MRRVAVSPRAGTAGYYLAVLAWIVLSGCGATPSAELPTTAGPEPGLADTARATVASTSTTRTSGTVPARATTEPAISVPGPEQEQTSTGVTSPMPTTTTNLAPDVSTVPATTEAAAVVDHDHDPVTAEPSGTQKVLVPDALPHDPSAFTQGLVLHDGVFYQSTGLYGASTLWIAGGRQGGDDRLPSTLRLARVGAVNVLLVCDVPWVRNQVRAALSGVGDIVEITDPYEAEVVAASDGGDVAIVDMQVGSMGGMAITRALKGVGPEFGPIVLLLDRRADAFIARRAGADAWVLKPFSAQQLRAVLDSVLPVGVDR